MRPCKGISVFTSSLFHCLLFPFLESLSNVSPFSASFSSFYIPVFLALSSLLFSVFPPPHSLSLRKLVQLCSGHYQTRTQLGGGNLQGLWNIIIFPVSFPHTILILLLAAPIASPLSFTSTHPPIFYLTPPNVQLYLWCMYLIYIHLSPQQRSKAIHIILFPFLLSQQPWEVG